VSRDATPATSVIAGQVRRRRPLLSATVWGLLGVAAACGGGGGPDGYSAEHRADFVEDCTTSVATAETCGCFYSRLAAQVPFDRFRELEEELIDPAAPLPPDLAAMAAGCAGAEQRRTGDGGDGG
jgi:hypothetical protein